MTFKYRIRQILWAFVGTPELPPKDAKILLRANPYTGRTYMPRSYYVYIRYSNGEKLEDIAKSLDITRERVRQLLWKEYRHSNE